MVSHTKIWKKLSKFYWEIVEEITKDLQKVIFKITFKFQSKNINKKWSDMFTMGWRYLKLVSFWSKLDNILLIFFIQKLIVVLKKYWDWHVCTLAKKNNPAQVKNWGIPFFARRAIAKHFYIFVPKNCWWRMVRSWQCEFSGLPE